VTEPAPDQQTKVCPQCAEEVKAAALICRFCRYEFKASPSEGEAGRPTVRVITQPADPPPKAVPSTPRPPNDSDERITTKQYPLDAHPKYREADKAAMLAAGYEVWKEGHDGQGHFNVMYRSGPNWRPDKPLPASTPIPESYARDPHRRQEASASGAKPAKGSTPEAGAGDGTKQGLIGLLALGGLGLGGAGLFQPPEINWAMVAGGVVILVVAVVLMIAAFPNGMPDTSRERAELKRVTGNWTVPFVVRSYKNDDNGRALASKEAAYLTRYGYVLAGQSGTGSHVNVGRTASRVVLTGGLGLIFGASRSKGTIEITFVRQ
jgi:hypothetical protein